MMMHTLLRPDRHSRHNRPVLVDDSFASHKRLETIRAVLASERLRMLPRKGMTDNEVVEEAITQGAIVLTRDKGFVRHWRFFGRTFTFVVVETDAANSKWPEMLWVAVDTVDSSHRPIGVVLRRNRREIVWE